ncbi:hypothetical protein JRO89_XS02G0147400 [Xanthoceras sorbifolium]|uniref:Uncharacterized protein n=1 Tax=Xanthoceras sorbifolium TaxID=99658 RepID=A0ABQ8IG27_9ROSI|nr:hypothetical protein JRO89_XS02G0147400 [Xanthoceras sorbifolium]
MHHTASLVSIAKYKYEQIKDDGEEWASEHTEALYVKLEVKKASVQDQGFETDGLNIYRSVVRKASHGQVLSMGSGIKAMDVYGCCKESSMKDEFEQLKATQEEVKQMREFMKVIMFQSNIQLPSSTTVFVVGYSVLVCLALFSRFCLPFLFASGADVLPDNGMEHMIDSSTRNRD